MLLREVRTPTRLIYHINKRVTMYRYFDFGEKMTTFSGRYLFVEKNESGNAESDTKTHIEKQILRVILIMTKFFRLCGRVYPPVI